MKKFISIAAIALFFCVAFVSCTNAQHDGITKAESFSKGADISWLPQMESTGYKFYDDNGIETDCIKILKSKGINSVRLRVFVNPNNDKINGHCSKAETIAIAKRAQSMGMRIMINFHYSDSWADPGKQFKPKQWENHSFQELLNDVYNHTFDVLNALKTAGVNTEWVQIGNEIPGGFLWPEGNSSNWTQLGQLLNKGYDATKAVDKKIKVIVHIDEGNNKGKSNWFFNNATEQNVKYDVIGLSFYPFWINKDYTAVIKDLEENLIELAAKYDKEVMIVEVGGEDDKIENTKNLLEATIKAVKNVPNNKGIGVHYWEPQGAKSWSGYGLSAWKPNGKPSEALNAFR